MAPTPGQLNYLKDLAVKAGVPRVEINEFADRGGFDALSKGDSSDLIDWFNANMRALKSSAPLVETLRIMKDRIVSTTGSDTLDHSIRVCVPASVLDVPDQPDAAYKLCWGANPGVERHTGGPGSIRAIPLGASSSIKLIEYLLSLTDAGLLSAQAEYGQHFHQCGRCGSPLSDKDSKKRGLGPDCASKVAA